MSKGTRIGVVILDVVVMDVSRIDVTIMGSDSIDCDGMGNLGVRVRGGHYGRMVETMTVDDDGVGVHCRCFVFSVATLVSPTFDAAFATQQTKRSPCNMDQTPNNPNDSAKLTLARRGAKIVSAKEIKTSSMGYVSILLAVCAVGLP